MIMKHELSMDLGRRGILPRINAVQDDRYSRDLVISLYNNGTAWEPGAGVSAVVRYDKPDGTGGSYDILPDGTSAWKIEGNLLTVALAPQVCTATGPVKLAVSLICGAAEISTFTVGVDVQPLPGLAVHSENYYKLSRTVPNSGWLPGKYLGTDENGNVVAVDAPKVDATLTQPGQAADAGAVGDALSKTVKTINGVKPDAAGNIPITISALPLPAAAAVGQYLRVLSVDASGKVTAVEAVDPEAGGATTITDTYLYNGVELPALPAWWDRKEYPYAAICENGYLPGYYNLMLLSAGAYYFESDSGLRLFGGTDEDPVPGYSTGGLQAPFDSWGTPALQDNMNMTAEESGSSKVIWTNFNLTNADGTTLMAASEPVPVDGEEENTESGGVGWQTITLTTSAPGFEATVNTTHALTEDESAALEAASAAMQPIIVALPFDDSLGTLYWPFGMMRTPDSVGYVGVLMDGVQVMLLRESDGTWMMLHLPAASL